MVQRSFWHVKDVVLERSRGAEVGSALRGRLNLIRRMTAVMKGTWVSGEHGEMNGTLQSLVASVHGIYDIE